MSANMLTPAELNGINIMTITKNILTDQPPYIENNRQTHYNEWITHTWMLYLRNEVAMTEDEFRAICHSETLDSAAHYYFALVCSMRLNNTLTENERVLCRALVSQNPFHTNMVNNINQQMYHGDVICFMGPFISAEEANHAPMMAKKRSIEGKIGMMINIARIEKKKLTWVMIPPALFANPNLCTMFLPDTIDGFEHCYDTFQNTAESSE